MADNQQTFFGKLKKLFSSQAIVTIDSDGRRKVVDTDERQMSTNLVNLKDRYTKLQRSFRIKRGLKKYFLSRAFVEWWYSPTVKGGMLAKKELTNFVNKM